MSTARARAADSGAAKVLAGGAREVVLSLLPVNGAPVDQQDLERRAGLGKRFGPARCGLATAGVVYAWAEGGRHWVRRRTR